MSNHKYQHHEDDCCAHAAAPAAINLNPSVAGNLRTTLHVVGVDCAEEVSAIQRALKPLAGVRDVKVNIMSGKTIIAHDKSVASETLIKAIGGAGLKATREGEKSDDDAHQAQKQRLVSVAISGAFTGLGLIVHWTHFAPESAALWRFLVAIVSGGWFIAPKAWRRCDACARYERADDRGRLGPLAIGEWSEGAAVHFLFALSELLEAFSLARARKAVQALMQLTPETALLKDGDFREVPVEK